MWETQERHAACELPAPVGDTICKAILLPIKALALFQRRSGLGPSTGYSVLPVWALGLVVAILQSLPLAVSHFERRRY